jgi:hypothetical protein
MDIFYPDLTPVWTLGMRAPNRLTTFCRSQNRTKKYKGPPFDNYKKIISQFCKQYTYSINLKVYLVFDFSFFNISLLFLTESQLKKILN